MTRGAISRVDRALMDGYVQFRHLTKQFHVAESIRSGLGRTEVMTGSAIVWRGTSNHLARMASFWLQNLFFKFLPDGCGEVQTAAFVKKQLLFPFNKNPKTSHFLFSSGKSWNNTTLIDVPVKTTVTPTFSQTLSLRRIYYHSCCA